MSEDAPITAGGRLSLVDAHHHFQGLGARCGSAQAPNTVVKLSGFGLGIRLHRRRRSRFLCETIEAFGPNRVVVGTNLPVDRLFADGLKIFNTIETAVARLSKDERRFILSGTAECIYRI